MQLAHQLIAFAQFPQRFPMAGGAVGDRGRQQSGTDDRHVTNTQRQDQQAYRGDAKEAERV